MTTYVKVLLYAYPKLEKLAEASDRAVENKAMLSFKRRESTLTIAEEIVEEIAYARLLRAVKGEIDLLLSCCNVQEILLLEYKYFRRKKRLLALSEVDLGCSERNYFRKQNALIKKMTERFMRLGWTEEWFMREFSRSKAFMRAYRAVKEGRDRTVCKRGSQNSLSCSSRMATGGLLPRMTSMMMATAESPSATRKKMVVPEMPARSSVASSAGGGISSASVFK